MDFLDIIASPTVDTWVGPVLGFLTIVFVFAVLLTIVTMTGSRSSVGDIAFVVFILSFVSLFVGLFTYMGVSAADSQRYTEAVVLKAADAIDAEVLDYDRNRDVIRVDAVESDGDFVALRLLKEGSKWYVLSLE